MMYRPLDFLDKENEGLSGGVSDMEKTEGCVVIDEFKGYQDQYFYAEITAG
jgi:hypothetical protein